MQKSTCAEIDVCRYLRVQLCAEIDVMQKSTGAEIDVCRHQHVQTCAGTDVCRNLRVQKSTCADIYVCIGVLGGVTALRFRVSRSSPRLGFSPGDSVFIFIRCMDVLRNSALLEFRETSMHVMEMETLSPG